MTTAAIIQAATAATLILWPLEALPAQIEYTWSTGFINGGRIPDGNVNGWQDTRMVTTDLTVMESLAVTLNISSEFNGDLYASLTHDSGFVVLLNRVGKTDGNSFGYADAGYSVTLSDDPGVTTDIHLYGGNGGAPVAGVFQPDGREVDPAVVLDTSPRTTRLDGFTGLDPNGPWTLFVTDASSGAESVVTSWGVEIVSVPEPPAAMLSMFAGLIAAAGYRFVSRNSAPPAPAPRRESRGQSAR